MKSPLMPVRLLLLTAALAGFFSPAALAEVRTLTDQFGREIKAEVVAVDGNTVTIKREDGQTFNLSLSNLSDADQKALKNFRAKDAAGTTAVAGSTAGAKPPALPQGALTVELSRGIFKTTKTDVDVKLTTGPTIKKGKTITEEKWGYSVTLANHTSAPIENLRTEYRLFATVDDIQVKADVKQGLKKKSFEGKIDNLPELGKGVFKTETISAIKSKYNGNIVSAGSGESSSRETLAGLWIRIYRGDELVYEAAMPDSLRTTEKW